MITAEELERWRQLADEAAPGPWRAEEGLSRQYGVITHFFPVEPGITQAIGSKQNADFIAAARDAVPRLVARVRELEEEIARLNAQIGRGIRVSDDPRGGL